MPRAPASGHRARLRGADHLAQRFNAAVAYGGGSYLVVWKNTSDSRIIASRVGTDGRVLDPAGVTISPSAHNAAEPAIAFDGTNYLVAWDDNRNDPWGDIFAARVSPAGTVLDPSGIAVAADSSPAGLAQREPSVAANGSFLVAWRDDRRLGVSAAGRHLRSTSQRRRCGPRPVGDLTHRLGDV